MKVIGRGQSHEGSEAGKLPSQELLGRNGQVQRGTGESRRHAGRRRACSRARRARASSFPGQAHGHRRSLHRDQGADRRLLAVGSRLPRQEAIDWVKRCPNPHEGESEIEIRQVFTAEDFKRDAFAGAQRARREAGAQVAKAQRLLTLDEGGGVLASTRQTS